LIKFAICAQEASLRRNDDALDQPWLASESCNLTLLWQGVGLCMHEHATKCSNHHLLTSGTNSNLSKRKNRGAQLLLPDE
jgi:hypothetical protein